MVALSSEHLQHVASILLCSIFLKLNNSVCRVSLCDAVKSVLKMQSVIVLLVCSLRGVSWDQVV